ncbi:zinc finger protein 638-like [Solea senegalensis]|uniref:Zinc finger protein 638-like n=1 Tax=Solea senegalensis TaxID=28829 RepID=A0AAV6QY22_SOLSE|nr:zinc finger protein 638-like isoform X1 [Solea senegalensis]KAG7498037.1 zinc finger protein 638-like [Solea senegalensis]
MLEEAKARGPQQRRSTNIGRPEASTTDSRTANVSSDKSTDHVLNKSNAADPRRSFAWFPEHGPCIPASRPLTSPILGGIPGSSLLIGQQAASLQLAQLKAQLALTQLNNVGCQAAKLTPPSPTATAISLLNLLKIANTMSHPLCNPFASGNQSSIQGPHGLTAEKDLPGTSLHVGPESNFSFSAAYSASPANSRIIIPSHSTQSVNYGPEHSRPVIDADMSRAREELTFPTGQNTHYPMSSTSASQGHTLSDVEGKRSTLDWLPKYRGSTTKNPPKLYSLNSSGFSFNSSIERKCDVQSVTRLGDCDKPANLTEICHPKYTSEAATKILSGFGLEKEDLELLSLYPEDQLTPTNLPLILRQIRIQKRKRSTATAESKLDSEPQPIRSVRGMERLSGSQGSSAVLQPHKVIDYGHTGKYFGGVVDDSECTSSVSAKRDGSMLLDSYEQHTSSASRELLKNSVSQGKVGAFGSLYGQSSSVTSSSYSSALRSVAPLRNDRAKQLKIESNQTFDPILSSLSVPKKNKDGTVATPEDTVINSQFISTQNSVAPLSNGRAKQLKIQASQTFEPIFDKTVVLPEDPKSLPLKVPRADLQSASKAQSSYTLLHGMHPDRPGLVLISISDAKNMKNQDKTQGRTQENQEQKRPAVQTGKALRIPVISESKPAPQRSVGGSQSTSPHPVQRLQKLPTPHLAKPPVFKDLPTPAVIRYDTKTTPKVFPYTCSPCHIECSHMKDWIAHQNTAVHLENCRDLQTLSPGKDAKPSSSTSVQNSQKHLKKSRHGSSSHSSSPESRKLTHSYRYNHNSCTRSPRYNRDCSRLRSHESPRRRNKRRSSPRTSEERRSSQKRIRGSRSPSQRRDERRFSRSRERQPSPERSTKRKRSSSVEKLMMDILEKSESNAQDVVSTLLTELTKIKSSSPSPSAGRTTPHSSSSSAAKKKETTTGSRKASQQECKDTDQKLTPQKNSVVCRGSKPQINKSTSTTARKTTNLQTNIEQVEGNSANMSSKYTTSENPTDVEICTSDKSDTKVQQSVVTEEETDEVDESTNKVIPKAMDKSETTLSSQKFVIVEHLTSAGDTTKQSAEAKSKLDAKVQESVVEKSENTSEPSQVPEGQVPKVKIKGETVSSLQEPEIQAENFVTGENETKQPNSTGSPPDHSNDLESKVPNVVETKEKIEGKLEKPTISASKSSTPENRPAVETSKTKEVDTHGPVKVDESRNMTEEQNKLSNFEISSSQKPRLLEENLASAEEKTTGNLEENTAKPKDVLSKSTVPDKETSKSEESDTKVVVVTEDRDNVDKLLLFEAQTTTDKHINEETAVKDVKTVTDTGVSTEEIDKTAKTAGDKHDGLAHVPVTEAKDNMEANSSSPEPKKTAENLIVKEVQEKTVKPKSLSSMSELKENPDVATNVQQFVLIREDKGKVTASEKLTEPNEVTEDAETLDAKVQRSAVVPKTSGNVVVPELDCGAESAKVDAETKGTKDAAPLEVGETGADVEEPMEDEGCDETRPDLSAPEPSTVPPQNTEAEPPADTQTQNPQTDIKTPETSVKASSQDLQPEYTALGPETKMEASQRSSSTEDSSSKLSLNLSLKVLQENLQNHYEVTTSLDLNCVTVDANSSTKLPHSDLSEIPSGVQTTFPVAAAPETHKTESNARPAGDVLEMEDSQKLVAENIVDSNSILSSTSELLHIDKDAFMAIKAAVCQYRFAKQSRAQTDSTAGDSNKDQESGEVTEKMDEKPVASTSQRSVRRRSMRGKRDDLPKELEYEKTSYKILDSVEDETVVKEPTVTTRFDRGRRERTSRRDVSTDKTKKEDTFTRRRRASARETPKKEEEPPKLGTPTKIAYEILDTVEEDNQVLEEMMTTEVSTRGTKEANVANHKDRESNSENTAVMQEELITLNEIIEEDEAKVEKSTQEVHIPGEEDRSGTSSTLESTTVEAEETSTSDGHKDHNGTVVAKGSKMEFDGPEVKRSRQVPRVAANFKMPPFNPSSVFGPEFVVPKSGFFCNICRLFFLKDVAAKSHCGSQQHYYKLQKYYEELQRKLARRQTPKCPGSSSG